MNFTHNEPKINAAQFHIERPNERTNIMAESWTKPTQGHHHLNPSKSKINVRTFLNKTGQNFCLSHPNLDNIRGSCFLANPPKASQHTSRDSFIDDKAIKSSRASQQIKIPAQIIQKDPFPKFTFTPVGSQSDDRKKSDSTYLRSSLKESSNYRQDEDLNKTKEERAISQLRSQILSLTKKVFLNQEEINKLKEKKEKDKDKKLYSLEQQFTQFQIQMFDICKKNTNYFSEFENKIDKNNKLIEKYLAAMNRDSEKDEEIKKRINECQSKIIDINTNMKVKEDLTIKNIAAQLNMEESMMKKFVNEQVTELKSKIEKNNSDKNTVLTKIDRLEKQLFEKKLDEFFKKDHKKSLNAIVIDKKQVITINNGNLPKENSQKFVNNSTSRKEFSELNNRDISSRQKINQNTELKNEIIIKQNTYYIDPYGFLLDQNQYYLLNSKNQQILLPERMISTLKENNMLLVAGNIPVKKRQ